MFQIPIQSANYPTYWQQIAGKIQSERLYLKKITALPNLITPDYSL
jgi:hypothetical protein